MVNIKQILSKKGHSGLLQGNALIHYDEEKYKTVKDFLMDGNASNIMKITFSSGLQPLGDRECSMFGPPYGKRKFLVKLENNSVIAEIKWKKGGRSGECRFFAFLAKKLKKK